MTTSMSLACLHRVGLACNAASDGPAGKSMLMWRLQGHNLNANAIVKFPPLEGVLQTNAAGMTPATACTTLINGMPSWLISCVFQNQHGLYTPLWTVETDCA